MGADGQCPAQWPYLELFLLCGAFPEGADTPGGARASSGVPMEGGALAGRSPPSRIAGPRKPRNVGAARLCETPMILWGTIKRATNRAMDMDYHHSHISPAILLVAK